MIIVIKRNYTKLTLLLLFILSCFTLSSCSMNSKTHYYDVINGYKKYDYKNPRITYAALYLASSVLHSYDKGYELLKLFDDVDLCNNAEIGSKELEDYYVNISIYVIYHESLNICYSNEAVNFYITKDGTLYFETMNNLVYYSVKNAVDYTYIFNTIKDHDNYENVY